MIRRTVFDIVSAAESDPLPHIDRVVAGIADERGRGDLRSLLIEELNGVHEGSVARYGLTLEDLRRWREAQASHADTRPSQST